MAYPSPLVSMLNQESPEYKRRMLASQMLMQQGPAQNPSKSPIEGALRMLTQIGGGFLANRAMAQDEAQRSEAGKMLTDAMTNPTEPGGSDRNVLVSSLAGSSNPYARQFGNVATIQQLLSGPAGSGTPESFGAPVSVMGPEGKPVLIQPGNRGTIRPVEGFSPKPEEQKAAAEKWLNLGGGTFMNPDTNETKFDPQAWQRELQLKATAAPRTSVNVGGPQVTFPRPETEKAADVELGKSLGQMAGTLVKDSTQRTQDLQAVNSSEKLLDRLESVGRTPGKFAEQKAEISRLYHAATNTEVPSDVQDFRTLSAQLNKDVLGMIGKGGIPANNFSDADRAFIQKIATSPSDDPGTLRAKFAIRRASIKAEDYVTKQIMDMRRQGVPTETAVTQAMAGLQNKNFIADEPAAQRWMAENTGGAPATPAGPQGPSPSGTAAQTAKKRIKIDAQGNIIQ